LQCVVFPRNKVIPGTFPGYHVLCYSWRSQNSESGIIRHIIHIWN